MDSLDLVRTPYIQDIRQGLLEEGHFLLKKLHLNVGKKNKPYLRLLLADKTGHLPAVFFENMNALKKIQGQLQEGVVVKVSGIIEEYQNVLQLRLLKIEKDDKPDWDLSRFWKRTPHDRRELYRKLKGYLEKIKEPALSQLCLSFLKDKAFMKLFLEAPASRYVHHAYIGGLLEHTLNVVELCYTYARVYEQADHDLLMAGAFIHDIGKIDEYVFLFEIDHSALGKLKGHTLLGYDRLQQKLQGIKIDDNLRLKIEHIMLSHQGQKRWGAVEEPRFLEAYLVHAADSTDSSQFIYSNARRERKARAGSDDYFSDYVSYLGRDIYLG